MNTKMIAKVLGVTVGAATLVGAVMAHATIPVIGTALINPNDGVAWGSWGAIVESDNASPATLMVRGQVSKRHSRDRLFYNTTSNIGGYDRWLRVACTNQPVQDNNPVGGFATNEAGDLTLYCDPANQLILPAANLTQANQVNIFTNASFATITAHPF